MVSEVMPTASCSGDSEDQSDELATQRLSGELSQCVSIDLEVSKDEGMVCTSASVWAIATWKRSYSDPRVPGEAQMRHLGGRPP